MFEHVQLAAHQFDHSRACAAPLPSVEDTNARLIGQWFSRGVLPGGRRIDLPAAACHPWVFGTAGADAGAGAGPECGAGTAPGAGAGAAPGAGAGLASGPGMGTGAGVGAIPWLGAGAARWPGSAATCVRDCCRVGSTRTFASPSLVCAAEAIPLPSPSTAAPAAASTDTRTILLFCMGLTPRLLAAVCPRQEERGITTLNRP